MAAITELHWRISLLIVVFFFARRKLTVYSNLRFHLSKHLPSTSPIFPCFCVWNLHVHFRQKRSYSCDRWIPNVRSSKSLQFNMPRIPSISFAPYNFILFHLYWQWKHKQAHRIPQRIRLFRGSCGCGMRITSVRIMSLRTEPERVHLRRPRDV